MPPYWFEKDMASVLLIDALANEAYESESEFHDIFGSLSGAELTEAIPYVHEYQEFSKKAETVQRKINVLTRRK